MKEENKNVKILSIEGKDLLTKNYTTTERTLYKASLDDSIEIDELRELAKKFIRKNKKDGRLYTDEIITVTFKYACKPEKDYDYKNDDRLDSLNLTLSMLEKELSYFEITNKDILSSIDKKNKEKEKLNEEEIKIEKQFKNLKFNIKNTSKIIKTVQCNINKKEIRQQLYKHGFNININVVQAQQEVENVYSLMKNMLKK